MLPYRVSKSKPPPLPSFSLQPCRSTTNMLNKLQVTILETLLIIIAIIVTAQYFGLLWWYYFYRELSYFNSTIDQSIEISLGNDERLIIKNHVISEVPNGSCSYYPPDLPPSIGVPRGSQGAVLKKVLHRIAVQSSNFLDPGKWRRLGHCRGVLRPRTGHIPSETYY